MQQAHDELREALRVLWREARAAGLPTFLLGVWVGMAICLIASLGALIV